MVQRTISFLIKATHPDYQIVVSQAVQSKKLYNGLNSVARVVHAKNAVKVTSQETEPVDERLLGIFNAYSWVNAKPFLGGATVYETLRKQVEQVQEIRLPQKIAQHVGRELAEAWSSFYQLRKKGLYSHPPGYKRKYGTVRYTKQALSLVKPGWVKPTGWSVGVQLPSYILSTQVQAGRIVHSHAGTFKLEIIYNIPDDLVVGQEGYVAGIDFGLNNLITLVTTKPGERPKIVTGRELKSINHFYNKKTSQLKARLAKGGEKTSNEYQTLWGKRNRKINHILHSVSSQVIEYLVDTGVKELIIGWNIGFKDQINLGRKNNQQFTQIPHGKLKNLLSYKAQHVGIKVTIQEESYTSKANFINNDPLPIWPEKPTQAFTGKRTSRGVYKTNQNQVIHADVNGAWNIVRKSKPTICWFRGIIVMPERLNVIV